MVVGASLVRRPRPVFGVDHDFRQAKRTDVAHEKRNVFFRLLSAYVIPAIDHITEVLEALGLLQSFPDRCSRAIEAVKARQVADVPPHRKNERLPGHATSDNGIRPDVELCGPRCRLHVGFRDRLASRKTPVFAVLLQGYNLPLRIMSTSSLSGILAWAHEQRCCRFGVPNQNPRGQNPHLGGHDSSNCTCRQLAKPGKVVIGFLQNWPSAGTVFSILGFAKPLTGDTCSCQQRSEAQVECDTQVTERGLLGPSYLIVVD